MTEADLKTMGFVQNNEETLAGPLYSTTTMPKLPMNNTNKLVRNVELKMENGKTSALVVKVNNIEVYKFP